MLSATSSAWTRTDDNVGLTATANKHTTAPTDFVAAKDDFAMGAHGGELYFYKDIDIVNIATDDYGESGKSGDILDRLSTNPSEFNWGSTKDGVAVDIMTYYPGHYIKRWQDTTHEHIQLSMGNFDGAMYIAPYYRGTFEAVTGTKDSKTILRSYVNATPKRETTIASFRTYAGNNDMSIGDWRDFDFLCLYLIKYANYNSQAMVGRGIVGLGSKAWQTGNGGAHTTLLGRDGYIGSGATATVWCLGLCNPWGNVYEFVDGIYINNRQAKVATTGSYNNSGTGENYKTLGYPNLNGSDVWVSKLGYDANNPLIAFPTERGGGDSTGICDKYWSADSVRVVLRGGSYYYTDATRAGAFSFACSYDFTTPTVDVGCRLLKTA